MPPLPQNKNNAPNTTGPSKQFPGQNKDEDSFGLRPLRTYQSDVESVLKENQGSLTSIATAESNRKTKLPDHQENEIITAPISEERPKSRKWIIIISISLVVLSALLWVWFLFQKGEKDVLITQNESSFTPLVSADIQKAIDITGKSGESVRNFLETEKENLSLTPATFFGMYFTKQTPEKTSEKQLVSSGEFLTMIGSGAPSSFLRTLDNSFMFGFYSLKQNEPFLILKPKSYENSFAGMLDWEKSIQKNIGGIFIDERVDNSSTTNSFINRRQFEDAIIKNRDARVLKNQNGVIIFLYSFPDKNTLVITTTPDVYEEINDRLLTDRLAR
ncbi:MAG: hypothetical protein COV70_00890 [Parcubacteria group bacterium CG11_big_fil_rev_8_21_14_0_20_39_22]|nr:MAG: hypothetical protein COV70_00890 [Parcubacteria group bacterium CG11_big_fil_rev_8_21_14_0_20_39_22]